MRKAQLLESVGGGLMESGFRRVRPNVQLDNTRIQAMQECMALLRNDAGHDHTTYAYLLREAMTTDTFPLAFADSLARELRARYGVARPGMMQIARRGIVPDFRDKKSFRVDGLTGRLQQVAEKGEYLASELSEDRTTYAVSKYGRQCDFSWEAYINDDLGIFSDIAQRLADACTNTLEYYITSLLWAAAGPIDASFAIATATTPLTIAALETGVEAMNAQVLATDTGNVPILARPKYLIVGPALEYTARQILSSTIKQWTYGGDDEAAAVPYPTTNVIASDGLQLIVNPWIPIVDTTSGGTTWALTTAPSDLPLVEIGFLRGHEEPEIHMKASNMQQVGGGAVSPFEGDFETDNIFYRVRYVFGGTVVEDVAGYASTGAG